MCISLRPVSDDDHAFLFELYASTREEELNAWGWGAEERTAFLKQQFEAQRRSYAAQFPEAEHQIVLRGGEAIGRLFVSRAMDELRLIDITLLPQCHGRGIGTGLMRNLLEEGKTAARPVYLHVLRDSPARRLYERLGFVSVRDGSVYTEMVCPPEDCGKGPTDPITGP